MPHSVVVFWCSFDGRMVRAQWGASKSWRRPLWGLCGVARARARAGEAFRREAKSHLQHVIWHLQYDHDEMDVNCRVVNFFLFSIAASDHRRIVPRRDCAGTRSLGLKEIYRCVPGRAAWRFCVTFSALTAFWCKSWFFALGKAVSGTGCDCVDLY